MVGGGRGSVLYGGVVGGNTRAGGKCRKGVMWLVCVQKAGHIYLESIYRCDGKTEGIPKMRKNEALGGGSPGSGAQVLFLGGACWAGCVVWVVYSKK